MLSVILSVLMIPLSTLNLIRQQLELVSELKSDLRDTGLGHEVACFQFQCWKNLTSLI